jgi:signal transduction histidine kinase
MSASQTNGGGASPPLAAAAAHRDALSRAFDDLQARGTLRLAQIRVAAAGLFLAMSVVLGYGRGLEQWRVHVVPLLFYTPAAAAVLAAVRADRMRALNRLMIPVVDVAAVFVLQLRSMPRTPFPALLAGWSLGLFVVLVLLAALSFRRSVIYATVLTSWCAEGVLQQAVDAGWANVVSSGVVLFAAAAAVSWAATRLEALVAQLVTEEERLAERNRELGRANLTIARVNDGLAQAQREAEMLTSLLVHDMKGPLTGVIGSMSLLEEALARRPDSDDLLEDLDIARASVHRLSVMIGNLLGISRLESRGFEPDRQRTDVGALVSEVRRSFAGAATAARMQLATRADPALEFTIDRQLVQRLLDNLVSNALNHAADGNRIEIAAERRGPDLVIAVRNDGPPVPPEFRAQLFRKFFTLGARGYHNAGLGLYFCRLVAEVHGGRIALEDEPGWSVSFVARLPERAAPGPAAASLARDSVAA